ncbi:MAG TPA: phosphatase PAP2 family protein [Bryobacteraceae bacterium]|nr:phosphatase PAP2 family protein [Bryobacteraceae bacterium]
MAAYPILTPSVKLRRASQAVGKVVRRAVVRELRQSRVTRAIVGFGTRTDHGLMRRVNRWRAPKWLRLWMMAATRGGDGWLWYAMGSVVAVFGGRERFIALLAAAIAVALGIAIFLNLKRICGRRRPCVLEPHCWATLLPPDQFSFPSGHTITAFAVAVSLGGFYPAALAGLLFCAASVAASRILLGMHFLTDVIAGAMIGSVLGVFAAAVAASALG